MTNKNDKILTQSEFSICQRIGMYMNFLVNNSLKENEILTDEQYATRKENSRQIHNKLFDLIQEIKKS